MDKKALQTYAVWAKNNLENQIEVALKSLGINSVSDIKEAKRVGEYTIIDGDMNSYPADMFEKRNRIIDLIKKDGYHQTIEEFAYTWFNRIVALRFMEVHDFLPHGFRVLSSRDGGVEPEIMKNISFVKDDLHIDMSIVEPLISQGKTDEAFRYVLFRQCKALSGILPMLFQKDYDYLELLLPKALLKGETFITKLIELGEEPFLNDVEVIGWLYQFYVASDRQEFRNAKTVTKDLIPTLTQIFTPDWIVKYMAENSVGRIWLESYPSSSLKSQMKYYVEDAKQEEDVQKKIDEIKYKNVNPEEIRVIEPCCGSGHILVYVFDLLYKMYEEKGYQPREIPTLILKKNLVGLEIDKRAAQLAAFSLVMKARAMNSRFFNETYYTAPAVYEILDSKILFRMNYKKELQETRLLTTDQMDLINWLVNTFEHAKVIGSLLMVQKKNFETIQNSIQFLKDKMVVNVFNEGFYNEGLETLDYLLKLAEVMSAKYDVMITNPPYLSLSKIEETPKDYLKKHYPNSKADFYAMFMEAPFVKENGYLAMVNSDGWMFQDGFKDLREKVINQQSIVSMIHLGTSVFDAAVATTSFIIRNTALNISSSFFVTTNDKNKESAFLKINGDPSKNRPLVIKPRSLMQIPNSPIAYWFNQEHLEIFNAKTFNERCVSGGRNKTHNNDLYVRCWWEVKGDKWKQYANGGDNRKWYGSNIDVVDWSQKARTFYDSHGGLLQEKYWEVEGITWNDISSVNTCYRIKPKHSAFSSSSPTIITKFKNGYDLELLGFLNSKVSGWLNSVISPTLHTLVGNVLSWPDKVCNSGSESLVTDNISMAKLDWDSFEVSSDFKKHPLLPETIGKTTYISKQYLKWEQDCHERFVRLKANEEELNRIFIRIYGLEDELTPEEADSDITINIADKKRDIKSLISYLIGVEMGRYSLDVEGIAYAGGEWNPINYVTYQPDDDGIIPVYDQIGMNDGLTTRLIGLIKHVYGEDAYRENIDFIGEALGKNSNESSEEALNRYLNNEFYQDHLYTYKSKTSGFKPIYWMFSSGKNNAFKCLVYLHRYTKDTLAIINSKYFLNESARLNAEVKDVGVQLETADGRDKLRLDKLYKILTAKQKEMIEYGQVLDHMANKYIPLDLDDGVKVNYAKFQGIEVVNDNGVTFKKDLLAPIK